MSFTGFMYNIGMVTVGIDEVGRGCWAGPLVAGVVLLLESIEGLADSKKLSKKRRNELAKEVHDKALIGLGWVWPKEIDRGGITCAVKLAMARALAKIHTDYDEVIIDGNINYLLENPKTVAIIRADGSVPVVSAASIVAKVARDTYMESRVHAQFPHYGFDAHVGYGTSAHRAALRRYGACEIHRQSYKPIQKLVMGRSA